MNETLNVLAIIADAGEEVRPDVNDYCIIVRLGKDEQVASVEVEFYNDGTYHKLLTFLKDNGQDLVETSSGKLIKHQAYYGKDGDLLWGELYGYNASNWWGAGLRYSIDSKLGPLNFDISSSNISRKVNLYFSLGYYF